MVAQATDPLFLLAAISAVIIVGISKSGFGAAFGSLAVPLLVLVAPPSEAVALLLPSLLVMDLMGLVVFRRNFDHQLLKTMLPAGLLGIVIGTLAFRHISEDGLKLLLGVISILFVLQRWFLKPGAKTASARSDAWRGRFWSTVSGFTSFVAHAGGPPISMYLIPRRMERVSYVGTTALFFAIVNGAKWLPYTYLGLFHRETLEVGAGLTLAAPVGYLIGLRLLKRLDGALFYRIVTLALLLTGLKLVWDGVTHL